MSYILSIETATKNCSVALSLNGNTIVCKEIAEEQFSHAEKLHIFIDDVLKSQQLTLSNLNAIAVSKGPGSYTGLRIGVSAAKGLCYALNIPLIAVDTLAVLAAAVKVESGIVLPMIDARRMEVFTQSFTFEGVALNNAYALIIEEDSLNDLNETIHLCGDGAFKCKDVLTNVNITFHDDVVYPSANDISKLAYNKFLNKTFEDVAYFEPFYLKDFMLTTKK